MKPRLIFSNGRWRCMGHSPKDRSRYVEAWGFTPVGAYYVWSMLAN